MERKKLKTNDIRRSIRGCQLYEHGKIQYYYFITTELGIEYDNMLLIFKIIKHALCTFSVHSRYNMEFGYPITHTIYGGPLREDGECDGILRITCHIPLHMKNYRLAILQEQKKILNILRSKIECRKASVSAKSGASK